MLDWEITEEQELPSSEEPTPDTPSRSRLGFFLVIGGILTVALLAVGVVTWRFQQAENTLEADLLGQIRAEESARRFGEREALSRWLAVGVPAEWRNRFSAQYQPPRGEVRPVDITIDSVEFSGTRASVMVQIGAQVQRRAYQLTDQGWRRVPLVMGRATFGTTHSIFTPESAREIYYRTPDEAFARTLAGDIDTLHDTIRAWYGESARWNMRTSLIPSVIHIQPQELTSALIGADWEPGSPLFINSPQVVSLSPTWDLSGESAVRFALANLFWHEVPLQSVNTRELPAVHRFADALRTVMALRWALSTDEYAALQAEWHAQARQTEWQSPFFALTNDGLMLNAYAPSEAELRLLLLADGVLDATGTNTPAMADILPALEQSSNWDEFFERVVGQKTIAFEASVWGVAAPAPLPLPFVASAADDRTTLRGFAVQPEGHPYSITIEGEGGATLTLPDGESLNPLCASMLGELEITGTWQEEGLRLQPSAMRVRRLTLPTTFREAMPPPNTVAYVAGQSDGSVNGISQISALGDDGQLTPVLVPAIPDVISLNGYGWGMTDSTTGIMLSSILSRQGCNAQWMVRYVPGQGITGAWFVQHQNPNTFLQTRWDDVSGRGILVELNSASALNPMEQVPFWWLEEGEPQVVGNPDGYLPGGSGFFLAPGATTGMMYQLTYDDSFRSAIVVVDLATQTEQAVYTAPNPGYHAIDFAFSADGTAIFMVWTVPQVDGTTREGSLLQRVELATGEITEWWSPEQGSIFFISPDLRASHLYAMTLTYETPGGVHLMKLNGTEQSLIGETGEAFGISLIRRCHEGGLLYLRLDTPTEQETRYELDPRYVHIVSADATEQEQIFPLSASQLPLLCP